MTEAMHGKFPSCAQLHELMARVSHASQNVHDLERSNVSQPLLHHFAKYRAEP